MRTVEREYGALALATVSWPDPHANGVPVLDEEYSSVTAPARYRIVGGRADAWELALTGLGLASAEPTDVPHGWNVVGSTATRLVPMAQGALPLIVVRGEFEDTPETVIAIGVDAETPLQLALWPDCGCDACDNGSECLLQDIDDSYLSVVAGGFVYASHGDWWVHTTYDGWQGIGNVPGDIERIFADALEGRPTTASTITGGAWWS